MGLTTAGLTAVMEDGNEAALYAAVGDGPTSADQVSTGRVLITWGAPAGQSIEASNVPLQFTGTPDGAATHLLLFSAGSGGTFLGATEMSGDQVFNSAGEFEIPEIVLSAAPPDAPPAAPEEPFTNGTEVGVPTGTTLTTRTSLGASNGGTGVKTLTHPVTGDVEERPVQIWQNLRFTETFTITNPDPETQSYLFRNCRWDVPETAWTVEVDQATGVNDQMIPAVIFEYCEFQGQGNSNIGAAANFSWFENCDVQGMLTASPASGASDGIQGAAYTVVIDSNVIAGTNEDLADPHSDGIQCTGTGHSTLFHCWLSAGASEGRNSAVRFGTEDGGIASVQVHYCTLDNGGYAAQFRGDAGAGNITGVSFVGNRFTRTAVFGPTDFEETTVVEWTDNAYLDDGEIIPNPAP
jgi:hypothetical protein